MLGVILCGGQSSRMGRDKALLKQNNNLWAFNASNLFVGLELKVVLSINHSQKEKYENIFLEEDLIVDDKQFSVHGPLLGVLSVHEKYNAEDLFVLACDMPLMQKEIIKELIAAYENKPGFDAYVFAEEKEPEPLCAVYTTKALNHIKTLYNKNKLKKHSMKFMLEQLNVCIISITKNKKSNFTNINTHAQLNGL
jgi:molybdopterin-guanine dinucleotide biosynthesis protein A